MTLSSKLGLTLAALAALGLATLGLAIVPAKADIAIQFGSGNSGYTAFSGDAAAAYTGTWLQQASKKQDRN